MKRELELRGLFHDESVMVWEWDGRIKIKVATMGRSTNMSITPEQAKILAIYLLSLVEEDNETK